MIGSRYNLAGDGQSPFEDWFSGLDLAAGASVFAAIVRLEQGKLSSIIGYLQKQAGLELHITQESS